MAFQDLHHMASAENALFKILVSFTDHHCLPHFLTNSQWAEETMMASFQQDYYVGLVI